MIDTDATTARVQRGAKEHRNTSGHELEIESERTEQRQGGEAERERGEASLMQPARHVSTTIVPGRPRGPGLDEINERQ